MPSLPIHPYLFHLAPILIQQRNMIDNVDQTVILDYLHSAAYQRTPYGNAPVGNKAGLNASNATV